VSRRVFQPWLRMALVCWVCCSVGCSQTPPEDVARSSEAGLWETVQKWPLPKYPEESLRKGASGVAVAELQIGSDGHVRKVTILEAPDGRTAASTQQALRTWTFAPLRLQGVDGAVPVTGKITLYFCAERGTGRVLTVDQRGQLREAGDSTAGCDIRGAPPSR